MLLSTCPVIDHRIDNLSKEIHNLSPEQYSRRNPVDKYRDLPVPANKILATYVWIDGTGENMRWKDRTLDFVPKVPKDKFTCLIETMNNKLMDETFKDMTYSHYRKYLPPYYCPAHLEEVYKVECRIRPTRNRNSFDENIKDLPVLTYDGSGTKQATQINSDLYLCPRAIYRNPFRRGEHILVMCDTYDAKMEPTATNHRVKCLDAYMKCQNQEPWFGFEQELYFLNSLDSRPLGWPIGGYPKSSTVYFCGVGAEKMFARELMNAHYRCCLYAGIPVWGTNAEIGPSQWEYQTGPSVGVDAGDNLWMSRFILEMLAEEYGVLVSLDPKPVPNWSGSGAHTNFSCKKMRGENGICEIEKAIIKLSKVHMKHIRLYDPHRGRDNARRLTGSHETSNIYTFQAGVAERFHSIRIPRLVSESKKGYFEDRRPASNCDPYQVTAAIMRTCLLNQ